MGRILDEFVVDEECCRKDHPHTIMKKTNIYKRVAFLTRFFDFPDNKFPPSKKGVPVLFFRFRIVLPLFLMLAFMLSKLLIGGGVLCLSFI